MADRNFSCIFVSPKCENMETKQLKPLPVGIQTFDKLIESGCIYVDKTAYIHKMVKLSNYISVRFVSFHRRPNFCSKSEFLRRVFGIVGEKT